ncbi:PAS domain-containing protein [Aeoliella sp.]|uniref:PAS domain-containing protein n=1 Tax=Aeoliella sp. TaxID=2795800 RepID=UPI003CCC431B
MARAKVVPVNEPRSFERHELFFSLTDPKGIIRYGNDVFTRLAGYSEEEILGSPHNIIRHPDMPRAVFKLLWQYIKAGKSIAAYIKNMASDGRYYWVLATVTPCNGGFLSIRLKPEGPLFDQVRDIYAAALAIEHDYDQKNGDRNEAMDASLKYIMDQLAAAGYDNYDEFMSAALGRELTARAEWIEQNGCPSAHTSTASQDAGLLALEHSCRDIGEIIGSLFHALDDFQRLEGELAAKYEAMQKLGAGLHLQSVNATVAASRLGSSGAVLVAVADALGELSRRMESQLSERASRLGILHQACHAVVFGTAVSLFEAEVGADFAAHLQEDSEGGRDPVVLESMEALIEEFQKRCHDVLDRMQVFKQETGRIRGEVLELVNQYIEMRSIQINGKTEAATRSDYSHFVVLFDEVSSLIDSGRADCDELLKVLGAANERIRRFDRLAHSFQQELHALGEPASTATARAELATV